MDTNAPTQTAPAASVTDLGESERQKTTEDSSPSKKRAPPTSFLSLPHELRQQILLYTNEVPLFKLGAQIKAKYPYSNLLKAMNKSSELAIGTWRTKLEQVDPAIVGDVDYVCKVWESRRQKLYAKQSSKIVSRDTTKKPTKGSDS